MHFLYIKTDYILIQKNKKYPDLSLFIFFLFFLLSWNTYGQVPQDLPEGFPEIQINAFDEPEDGYVFLTPAGIFGSFPDEPPFLAILDNYATPVFYQKLEDPAFDFKVQQNGQLSFFSGGFTWGNVIMDSDYNLVRYVYSQGYSGTDFHEFLILGNGNYLVLGWDDRLVDMDTVVECGQPGVTVRGALIQEITPEDQVVWEWSSWDHFEITDAKVDAVDFCDSSFIDYVHANAFFPDTDTTLVMSSRNMYEITKINRNTGDIIWRFGGKNDQFEYLTDTMGFSAQHAITRLDNGNYLLFDNGWTHSPPFTCAVEYQLDEENYTATQIFRAPESLDILGWIMGNAQRLPGGNTMVGWGSGVPNVTEFKPDGTKALEFEFESVSYRAFKFPWETTAMSAETDSINFGHVYYADSNYRAVKITNNLEDDIYINQVVSRTPYFKYDDNIAVEISPGETGDVYVKFTPDSVGDFKDVLTLCYDHEVEGFPRRIALQVDVYGIGSSDSTFIDDSVAEKIYLYPGIANNFVYLFNENNTEINQILLFDGFGRVLDRVNIDASDSRIYIDLRRYASGVIFMQVLMKGNTDQKILKCIKL